MNPVPFLPVIRRIVRLYHTSFLESEDLVQEACLSLLEWDAPPDADFEHQLSLRIHRAIQSAIRQYESPAVVSMLPVQEEVEEFALADIESLMEACHLRPRVRQVLIMHYGLNGGPKQSYAQIAKNLGVSIDAVDRIISRAIRHLKQKFKKNEEFEK